MAKKSPLQKAITSKIGRTCWFKHPDTGAIVRGTYQRGRKVCELTSIDRPTDVKPGAPRTYMFNEIVWTVPKAIEIHFGQGPA